MKTTLENLPMVVKENRMRNLAENIVKYQKFTTSAFIEKIDNAGYTRNSLVSLISYSIVYLNTGRKTNKLSSNFYKYIDDAVEKIHPLTPSKEEKRERRGVNKKNTLNDKITPVQKVLKQISDKAKDDSKYQLAVKVGDSIKLASNKTYTDAFLDGMKFLGKTDAKLVKVRIEEID